MRGAPYMPPDVEPIDPVPVRECAPVWAWVAGSIIGAVPIALMAWEFLR